MFVWIHNNTQHSAKLFLDYFECTLFCVAEFASLLRCFFPLGIWRSINVFRQLSRSLCQTRSKYCHQLIVSVSCCEINVVRSMTLTMVVWTLLFSLLEFDNNFLNFSNWLVNHFATHFSEHPNMIFLLYLEDYWTHAHTTRKNSQIAARKSTLIEAAWSGSHQGETFNFCKQTKVKRFFHIFCLPIRCD